MRRCCGKGELRAWLDGELAPEAMERASTHLAECPACEALCAELAGRAAHVAALVDQLPECGEAVVRPMPVARRTHWTGAAVALAAGLAVAVYLVPAQQSRIRVLPADVAGAVVTPEPGPSLAGNAQPAVTEPGAPHRVVALRLVSGSRRVRTPRREQPEALEPGYFVALDNEPIESGIIMRVDVMPGNVQADIVLGPDGRARAFRVVNAVNRNF